MKDRRRKYQLITRFVLKICYTNEIFDKLNLISNANQDMTRTKKHKWLFSNNINNKLLEIINNMPRPV